MAWSMMARSSHILLQRYLHESKKPTKIFEDAISYAIGDTMTYGIVALL